MRKYRLLSAGLCVLALIIGLLAAPAPARAEAENLTGRCSFRVNYPGGERSADKAGFRDGQYTTGWKSKSMEHPYVTIASPSPVYGLYLCFSHMPESYEIQVKTEQGWTRAYAGRTDFHHVFYPMEGAQDIRIYADGEGKCVLGFNELFLFGEGEIPSWVQRWEPTEEKADILFLMGHQDDELLFLGGAIPTYDIEKGKRVIVGYLTCCSPVRRSEALNGLWSMGVRNYPIFGPFEDKPSTKLKTAYTNVDPKNGEAMVQGWVAELYRKYKPEVVVTHDLNGEYGHGQHKMIADACVKAWFLSGDAKSFPESAKAYGIWQVKKLYVHLYGDESSQTRFNWEQPLASLGGKTGTELAVAAYKLHRTQMSLTVTVGGKKQVLSVQVTGGKSFPNTVFGLYASTVGDDVAHDDFLEHIPE